MTTPGVPAPESSPEVEAEARLAVLGQYDILDTPAEQGFDDIVLLASRACDTPVALVSFVATDRQWFKARVGFPACQTPLNQSVCALAIQQSETSETFVIPDLTLDIRTRDNALVTNEPFIRFYAGALLRSCTGVPLGTLCVIDTKPRPEGLTEVQQTSLEALARQVGAQLELRRLLARGDQQIAERTRERDRLWQNTQDLQVIVDDRGTFLNVNPSVTRVLGWSVQEMVGHSLFDFILPEDEVSTGGALRHAIGQVLPTFENRYRHKQGGFRWISWVAAPDGNLIYASGRNVTADKEQAAELAAAQDALRQAQKMEAVGQLTGGLAHDFNNLLTGITGSLELLQTRLSQGRVADVDRYVNAAQGAARRAASLTHRLLAFARRQTLDPKPTDVNRLVSGMQVLIERTTGPEIAIELVAAVGLWATLVDPGQLEGALLNLCINARDAMPGGGRLIIETANRRLDERGAHERGMQPGHYVSLCVSDNGTGMTADVAARAFDPFFTTKPIGGGTGLGLSMVYGFARQSGGQVRIYSEVGQGTMLCLYLPRHSGDAPAYEDAAEPSAAPRAEHSETVLVVDDEPTVRMLVTEVLGELGYTAIEATEGAAGLRLLQSDACIDLLVTDVGLPGGMNGRQLADAARVVRPGIKVLFITGYAENAMLSHGHLEPGMHVLTKPFAIEALASRIRELIMCT